MKKYISLLLISVFLIPLIQTINAQLTTGPVGNQFNNLISAQTNMQIILHQGRLD